MLDYLHANAINVASSKYRSACLKFQISVDSLVGPSKIDYREVKKSWYAVARSSDTRTERGVKMAQK